MAHAVKERLKVRKFGSPEVQQAGSGEARGRPMAVGDVWKDRKVGYNVIPQQHRYAIYI